MAGKLELTPDTLRTFIAAAQTAAPARASVASTNRLIPGIGYSPLSRLTSQARRPESSRRTKKKSSRRTTGSRIPRRSR